MKQTIRVYYFILILFSTAFFSGCTSGNRLSKQHLFSTSAPGMETQASQRFDVTLQEWTISPAKISVPSGNITFAVSNIGPIDKHEFVVFKTDLSPEALPADKEGIDENGPGLSLVGEIEDIAVGADKQRVSFNLKPGRYVLVCNIWDEAEQESHYHKGMRTELIVTTPSAGLNRSSISKSN